MSRVKVAQLDASECEARSVGTDAFTQGWWFHGTTHAVAEGFISGRRAVRSPLWLTRNPNGASQQGGKTVIRCTVHLNKSVSPRLGDDWYNRKEGNEGLDQPYEWLGVFEGRVFVDRNFIEAREDETADSPSIPTVGEELKRIQNRGEQESSQ